LWAATVRLVTTAIFGFPVDAVGQTVRGGILRHGFLLDVEAPIEGTGLGAISNYPGRIIARSLVDRSRALITRITRIAKNGVC
jgi:hypothetical protein